MQRQGMAESITCTCLEFAIVIRRGLLTTTGCLLTEVTQTNQ